MDIFAKTPASSPEANVIEPDGLIAGTEESLLSSELEELHEPLSHLERLTEALTDSIQIADVARVVAEQGIAALGARAGAVALVTGDGESLELVHMSGYADRVVNSWSSFPIAAHLPMSDVVRESKPRFWGHGDDFSRDYPELSSQINKNVEASAALPLTLGERTFGAIYFTFSEPRTFGRAERAFMLLLTRQCAYALERARLYEMERTARVEAEARASRAALLAEVGAILYDASLDYAATLAAIARLTVPRFADWCAVDVLDENNALQRLAVEHIDPAKVAWAHESHKRYPPKIDQERGIGHVLRTGKIAYSFDITDEMLVASAVDAGHLAMMRELDINAAILIPLQARERVLGVLTLVVTGESGRRFTDEDLTVAQEIGRRAGLAMENARLYQMTQQAEQKQRRIAETLQHALLIRPSTNDFPSVSLATLYEAAWDEAEIGGDFYDAFSLSDASVAFVVGDVTGKGLAAAAFTAEIKFALRTILRENPSPGSALGRLNRFLLDSQRFDARAMDSLVSLSLAVLNTRTGILACAAGGAEPPVLLRAEAQRRAEEIDAGGQLVGADPEAVYEEAAAQMRSGDLLLMVTDGLTEARQGKKFFGIAGVVEAAQEAAVLGGVDDIAATVLQKAKAFAGSKLRDDVCLLAARWRSQHKG